MSRRLSFSEKRRRKLTVKVEVDRLETRNTITEPISVLGLAPGAFRGLAQLGLMQVHGGRIAPVPLRAGVAQGTDARSAMARGHGRPLPGDVLPFTAVPPGRPASGGGGGAAADRMVVSPTLAKAAAHHAPDPAAVSNAGASAAHGLSTPWKPAKSAGGGAAMAPRGGSGNGALPAVAALVRGQAPRPAPPQPPAPPATIPGVLGVSGTSAGAATNFPAPVITRNAAAQALNPAPAPVTGSGAPIGGGGAPNDSPPSTPTWPSSIPENASSLPTSGGAMAMSFPYWPLYTVDANNGVVLFNNQYQQENLNGITDLYAQVKGASVSSYSWTLSGGYTSSVSGTSTYHLHVQWEGTNISGANQIETALLTVTDTSSHQESQTYDFVIPPGNGATMPTSASWPVTLPPDTVEPGAPAIASQGVSVDADSGALDSTIPLASYNPNVPAISLTYNSLTADPRPIVVVHHTLDDTQSVPVPVHSGLDGVMHNGVGAREDFHRWLIIGRSHRSPLSAIPTAQGPPCRS